MESLPARWISRSKDYPRNPASTSTSQRRSFASRKINRYHAEPNADVNLIPKMITKDKNDLIEHLSVLEENTFKNFRKVQKPPL